MSISDARQPQRGQGNNDSGKTGGTSGSYQSTVKVPAEDGVVAALVAAPKTLFEERLGAVTDLARGGYRTNPDCEPWSEDEAGPHVYGPYDRAAWRLDNAETITDRLLESDGVTTLQVLRLPAAAVNGQPQTLRTKMYRGQNKDVLWMELWDGARWNALDEVDLGPWAKVDGFREQNAFRQASNRASVLQQMGGVRLAAQRQAVAIIS